MGNHARRRGGVCLEGHLNTDRRLMMLHSVIKVQGEGVSQEENGSVNISEVRGQYLR